MGRKDACRKRIAATSLADRAPPDMKQIRSRHKPVLLTLILAFALAPLASCAQDLPAEEESWEGLDAEDIAQLEDENGVDYDTPDGDLPPTIAAAPQCVSLKTWTTYVYKWDPVKKRVRRLIDRFNARAKNNCSSYQRVRIIWAWASDGPCRGLSPGQSTTSWRNNGYVSEVRRC